MAHHELCAVSDEHGKKIEKNGFSVDVQKKEPPKKEK